MVVGVHGEREGHVDVMVVCAVVDVDRDSTEVAGNCARCSSGIGIGIPPGRTVTEGYFALFRTRTLARVPSASERAVREMQGASCRAPCRSKEETLSRDESICVDLGRRLRRR